MKTRYAYPAIFHNDETPGGEKVYWVEFPDIQCHTQGETIEKAVEMAVEALEGCIEHTLENGKELPKPTKFEDIKTDEQVMVITANIENIKSQTRYVKKNLSIPYWLNAEAEKAHINFSGVLQEALKDRLTHV